MVVAAARGEARVEGLRDATKPLKPFILIEYMDVCALLWISPAELTKNQLIWSSQSAKKSSYFGLVNEKSILFWSSQSKNQLILV